ncbi:hypothetical protein EV421DRAFT_1747700 [Armillaria borealis]|uniref:Uncharacterized protein n=1 Tax=Armillaria borealis TaxID=47425 RepID=A0AA39IBV9_9AGAR|nr:hypothetical protein EV421DRAFT_1747700 [Armillaria borealis]
MKACQRRRLTFDGTAESITEAQNESFSNALPAVPTGCRALLDHAGYQSVRGLISCRTPPKTYIPPTCESSKITRRLAIVLVVLLVGCLIRISLSSFAILAVWAFGVQFRVQDAWGVMSIQLAKMSSPTFLRSDRGYCQKTIVTHTDGTMENVTDYAKVQGIVIGCLVVFLVTLLGPEKFNVHRGREIRQSIDEKESVQNSRSWVNV